MEIKELGHVVLYVRDLERSRAFYRDVLRFPEVFASALGTRLAKTRTIRIYPRIG
jgi:catechol 2,3-dioxygenase